MFVWEFPISTGGPGYTELITAAKSGQWKSKWLWYGPDWKNINNHATSTIGFKKGPALSGTAAKELDQFISDLGSGKINLFKGPLNYQDGSVFVKAGAEATDQQIWYMGAIA